MSKESGGSHNLLAQSFWAGKNATARLGDLLVRAGAITPEMLTDVIRRAGATTEKVGELLTTAGYITSDQLKEALRAQEALRNGESDYYTIVRALRMAFRGQTTFGEALERACESAPNARRSTNRLGELLVDAGIVSREQVEQGVLKSLSTGLPLGRVLVLNGVLSESFLAAALNAQVLIRDGRLSREVATKALGIAHKKQLPVDEFEKKKGQRQSGIRLGELIVLAGLATELDVRHAVELGLEQGKPIGAIFCEQGVLSEALLERACQLQLALRSGAMTADQAAEALRAMHVATSKQKPASVSVRRHVPPAEISETQQLPRIIPPGAAKPNGAAPVAFAAGTPSAFAKQPPPVRLQQSCPKSLDNDSDDTVPPGLIRYQEESRLPVMLSGPVASPGTQPDEEPAGCPETPAEGQRKLHDSLEAALRHSSEQTINRDQEEEAAYSKLLEHYASAGVALPEPAATPERRGEAKQSALQLAMLAWGDESSEECSAGVLQIDQRSPCPGGDESSEERAAEDNAAKADSEKCLDLKEERLSIARSPDLSKALKHSRETACPVPANLTTTTFHRFLTLAGVATADDIERALDQARQSPIIVAKALSMAGVLDERAENIILKCYELVSHGALTPDEAVFAFNYCLDLVADEQMTPSEACEKLGKEIVVGQSVKPVNSEIDKGSAVAAKDPAPDDASVDVKEPACKSAASEKTPSDDTGGGSGNVASAVQTGEDTQERSAQHSGGKSGGSTGQVKSGDEAEPESNEEASSALQHLLAALAAESESNTDVNRSSC